jgi:hypothetical protein
MRKRKYSVLSLAAIMAVGVTSIAWGAATGQRVDWKPAPSPSKQAKKKPKGPVTLGVETEGTYDNLTVGGPAGSPSSHVERATIHFDKDLAYNSGTMPNCTKTEINTLTTEPAKAQCPNSIVGQGSAELNGVAGPAHAEVVAFKGSNQNELLLHARAGPPINTTNTLVGTIINSTKGGLYGKALDVKVDPLLAGTIVLLRFQTTINKVITKKAGKGSKKSAKKKKKKKPNTYLLSMNCSDKTWNIAGDFQFVDSPGGSVENKTLTGSDTAPCKQKPTKKKKK